MSEGPSQLPGPDLSQGVALNSLVDGEMLLGHVGGGTCCARAAGCRPVCRRPDMYALRRPAVRGALVGDACFSLRTGVALRPPALNGLTRWRVEQRDGTAYVHEPQPAGMPPELVARDLPGSVVIIGGGGAGNAAAETLRREGYVGAITLLSADASPPCDRPNLSKDYLAGTAEADWIPLRPLEFYSELAIDLKLGVRVAAIEPDTHALVMEDGPRNRHIARRPGHLLPGLFR
jgi:Pyridine nucleotide-disulphide oxidoreductase